MKNLLNRISVVFLSSIVFFLSIGVSISNKCCSSNPIKKSLGLANNIYFCKDISQNLCSELKNEKSCCSIEIEKKCCCDLNENNCSSYIQNFYFDFETLIPINNLKFNFNQYLDFCFDHNKIVSNSCSLQIQKQSTVRLKIIVKPQLSKIQSFLL